MVYLIYKGPDKLLLFWGPDGWEGNSYFAIKYQTEEAARLAMKRLGLDSDPLVGVRVF